MFLKSLLILSFALLPLAVFADGGGHHNGGGNSGNGGGNGGGGGVPLDGGISLLVAAGVGYGAKKMAENKKKNRTVESTENK